MRAAVLAALLVTASAPRADDASAAGQRLVEHVRASPRFNDPRGAFTYHGLHVVVVDAGGNVIARVDRDDLVLRTNVDLESPGGKAALRDLLALARSGGEPVASRADDAVERPIAFVEVAGGMALGYGTFRR